MQTTMAIEEIKVSLQELLGDLSPGDEVIITKNQNPSAKLVTTFPKTPRPAPGLGKGSILYMAPDFDAPIKEMKEYME